jgi:chemotaxis response regulator CheB
MKKESLEAAGFFNLKKESPKEFPIVGIGASAGGLEALEIFLGNVPENSDIAFIIVQHQDPTRKGDFGGAASTCHSHAGCSGQREYLS